MLEARDFVEAARERGFHWYAGVPCSYLTPFINYVLQEPALRYVSMANEGDAVALIAGVALGGADAADMRGIAMMQNSGLGNAVSPLTSLTWIFRLPQLLIVTWRGQPGVADEPQHALMGPLTPALLETLEIPWELFPTSSEAVGPALERATRHMDATGRPYALVMQKGSVKSFALRTENGQGLPAGSTAQAASGGAAAAVEMRSRGVAASARPSRREALGEVIAHTPVDATVVLASTGYCGRELYALADRSNHLYMVGSMGCVTPLALGLALARPDLKVVAVDGDGAALMRLGALATCGAYAPPNLWHLLLDNGAHESTGGQATVSALISFGQVAAGCGYASVLETDAAADIGGWLQLPQAAGPRFARVWIRTGTAADLPRPLATPEEVKLRLMRHIGPARGAQR